MDSASTATTTAARLLQERIAENKKFFLGTLDYAGERKRSQKTTTAAPAVEEPVVIQTSTEKLSRDSALDSNLIKLIDTALAEEEATRTKPKGKGKRAQKNSEEETSANGKRKKKGCRNNDPGRRVIGNRVYDSKLGTTCHQCRQKTLDEKVSCTNTVVGKDGELTLCNVKMDQMCLLGRYGETVAAARATGEWICPKCRGICNCSFCRKKNGFEPTGHISHSAREAGFTSVQDFLDHGELGALKLKQHKKRAAPGTASRESKRVKKESGEMPRRRSRKVVSYCELEDESSHSDRSSDDETDDESESESDGEENSESNAAKPTDVVRLLDRRRRTGAEVEYLVERRNAVEPVWMKRHLLDCYDLMNAFEEKRKAEIRAQKQLLVLSRATPSPVAPPSPSPSPTSGFTSKSSVREAEAVAASSSPLALPPIHREQHCFTHSTNSSFSPPVRSSAPSPCKNGLIPRSLISVSMLVNPSDTDTQVSSSSSPPPVFYKHKLLTRYLQEVEAGR